MQEMERTRWSSDVGWDDRQPAPPVELERVARCLVPLDEAFLTLARYQEEHARTAAYLRDCEIWALTAVLARSTPLWQRPARPTLRFEFAQSGEWLPYHLELGSFAHLVALAAPTTEELALVTAPVPSWARVTLHPGRRQAGHAGALAYAYTPIATAEAVALLGCQRILAQIEYATRAAGRELVAEAEALAARRSCLLTMERVLHVTPDPDAAPERSQAGSLVDWMLASIATSSNADQILVGVCVIGVVLFCGVLLAIL